MTYEEAVAYLESLIDFERATRGVSGLQQRVFKLDRMRALLDLLGDPHQRLRCIHVAGTKGKGSVCAFVDSILRAAGHRVGLYTQPGLVDMRERVMIDRRMIPKDHLVRQVERLRPCVERVAREVDGEVTYFEGMTALAFDYYALEGVDYVVLEVGLGGRLDATNVVTPAVSAITSIGFEHTGILGHTLEKIAGEKAGIVKEGRPVVSAPQQEEAMATIRSVCQERGARLVEVGRDVSYEVRLRETGRHLFDLTGPEGRYEGLEIETMGEHQVINAAVAVAAVGLLRAQGASVPEEAVRQGLKRTTWPGRMQVVGQRPTLVLDGAHTLESARGLVRALREGFQYDRLILVFGIATDKDISGVWRVLEREADVAFLTRSSFPKAAEPRAMFQMIDDTDVALRVVENAAEAFEQARAEAGPEDLICVTGSFYLIGDLMRHLGIPAQEEG
ncbi:MAG: bifunctional folylpolyglutamate synthase/dihydrofolate synthase [Candidatus Latescibacteria bacterium]|nr:bifunctional folylpolyglutamate synthase/dihydrofolate synthase [Candidatus Latescibacterota bacterium]